MLQENRELAEEQGRIAAQTDDKYTELMAKGMQYGAKEDFRRAGKTYREAIALRPDRPEAYVNLGNTLANSGHYVEAAQWYLEAKERFLAGSKDWAMATALAFDQLRMKQCAEVAKPEWWNDEGLKALSARVVRAAPNGQIAQSMRAAVLCGTVRAWEVGPRSAAELTEAAARLDRCVALHTAPAAKAVCAVKADSCRSQAVQCRLVSRYYTSAQRHLPGVFCL